MYKPIFQSLAALVLVVSFPALAQNPAASQQVDAMQLREFVSPTAGVTNAAPEFYPGETSDVGPQSLLAMQPRRQWVRAFADEQWLYSDNIFLADTVKQSSDVLVSTIHAALAPDAFAVLDGKLSPQIGYQHQWFSYGILGDEQVPTVNYDTASIQNGPISAFDFNVMTIFAGTRFDWHGWDISGGLDYRRFLDSNDYEEFYREIAPRVALHYTFRFTDRKSILIGYEGDYRFTRTHNPLPLNSDDYNNRTDQSFVLVGNWQLCSHAILQPFYRLQYSYYPEYQGGREDWLNTFGIALQLPFTENIALRTFISYDTMHTSGNFAQNFDKLDVGGGLNLSVRF